MIDTRQIHIDNEYFIKMSNNPDKNICVVNVPKNMIKDLPEVTYIYELERGCLNLYKNKQKILSKKCPDYAKRIMVWSHLCKISYERLLDAVPVVLEIDGQINNEFENISTILPLFALLEEPEINNDVELEIKLFDAITKCKNGGQPSKDVLEGYAASVEMYNLREES